MTNYYKRNRRYAGKPELLEPMERQYKTLWLQPENDSQVPMEVYVYEKTDGWHGYRATDDRTKMPEVFWIRGLWKVVPSPLPDVEIRELQPLSDNDLEDTMEVVPEP